MPTARALFSNSAARDRTRIAHLNGILMSFTQNVCRSMTVGFGALTLAALTTVASAQFNFAKIGIPALYFDRGTDVIGKPAGWGKQQQEAWEEHTYHQPSDQINDSWIFDGMIEDSQIGFYAAWLIAEAQAMPAWNKGDELEAARLESLKNMGSH